jgi:hypothetical protein
LALNNGSNKTFFMGQKIQVDVSMGAVVVIQPRDFRFNTGFSFRYGVIG